MKGSYPRDDFIAVQRMLNNAKFGGRSFIPELRVIGQRVVERVRDGETRVGRVSKPADFLPCIRQRPIPSRRKKAPGRKTSPHELQISVAAGDFDLRGF